MHIILSIYAYNHYVIASDCMKKPIFIPQGTLDDNNYNLLIEDEYGGFIKLKCRQKLLILFHFHLSRKWKRCHHREKNNLVNTDYISFVPLLVEKISTQKY